MKVTCHACGAVYSGTDGGPWHCAGCHRTFSSQGVFDACHRIDPDVPGGFTHLDPASKLRRDGTAMFVLRETRGSSVPVWGRPGTWRPS